MTTIKRRRLRHRERETIKAASSHLGVRRLNTRETEKPMHGWSDVSLPNLLLCDVITSQPITCHDTSQLLIIIIRHQNIKQLSVTQWGGDFNLWDYYLGINNMTDNRTGAENWSSAVCITKHVVFLVDVTGGAHLPLNNVNDGIW